MDAPKFIQGDSAVLPFADDTFDCFVTSPPYFGQRFYGDDERETGRGDLDIYIEEQVTMMAEARRTLKPTGVAWYNVADTASNSGGAGGDHSKGSKQGIRKYRQGDMKLPGNQWGLVPYRLALAFQAEGWLIRSMIVWDKMRTHPESLKTARRPGYQYETIIMMVKHKSYRFYDDRLVERGNIWHFRPSNGKQHVAPFPDELPRRCILPSTEPGDLVLDVHSGTGTTARVAESLDRYGFGVELYADVVHDAASRENPMNLAPTTRRE